MFDVVNNKLKVIPGLSIRISSGWWAVFNQAKTFNLGNGVIHDKASAYRKGAIVTRSGTLFQANAAIPANTDFKTGTTGATWSNVGAKAQELIIGGITPAAAARYGPDWATTNLSNYTASSAGELLEFTFGCSDCNNTAVTAGLFTFNLSTKKVVKYQAAASTAVMSSSTIATFTLATPLAVASGEAIGIYAVRADGQGVVPYGGSSTSAIQYYYTGVPGPSSTVSESSNAAGLSPRFEYVMSKK